MSLPDHLPVLVVLLPLLALLATRIEQLEGGEFACGDTVTYLAQLTMEDVVESFLGLEIVDESDSVEDMRALAKRRWRERARRLGLLADEDGV